MSEPSRRSSRLALAAFAACAIGLTGGGFMLGRYTTHERPEAPAEKPVQPAAAPQQPEPALPTIQPPLGRPDLIAAAFSAADAFAAAGPAPPSVAALKGRQFALKLPFGCGQITSGSLPGISWQYDREEQTLRVSVKPVSWPPERWAPGAAAETGQPPSVEAIEGFWIRRPWTSAETCPAQADPGSGPAGAPDDAAPGETLGIAQFFSAESSRINRRAGKGYDLVKELAPDAFDPSRGFRLVLRGRIAAMADRQPIICRPPARSSERPHCLISAEFDEVLIENASTGEGLARWDVSSPGARMR